MDFAQFDKRGYPVVNVRTGYGEWAADYETTVAAGLDRPLLNSLKTINWKGVETAADLACGTGRTGTWLAQHGVRAIDGVDITREMIEVARAKNVYRHLQLADLTATGLPSSSYQLATLVLADEHLADLEPAYREAARLLVPGGSLVLIGYHPFFLMLGIPTHYHRAGGGAVTIEPHVHLLSEHYQVGRVSEMVLAEFHESVVDEGWLSSKPKWRQYLHRPISFALVWRRAE